MCYQQQNAAATTETELMAAAAASGVVGSSETDITSPYEAVPCGCVYCFVCLASALEREGATDGRVSGAGSWSRVQAVERGCPRTAEQDGTGKSVVFSEADDVIVVDDDQDGESLQMVDSEPMRDED